MVLKQDHFELTVFYRESCLALSLPETHSYTTNEAISEPLETNTKKVKSEFVCFGNTIDDESKVESVVKKFKTSSTISIADVYLKNQTNSNSPEISSFVRVLR